MSMQHQTHHTTIQNKSIILLEVLDRIPEHSLITSAELFTELSDAGYHVPKRRLRRYLSTLSSMDLSVERLKNPENAGYVYRRNSKNNPLSERKLEAPMALLFAMALKRLHYLLPPTITKGMKPLFERAFDAVEGKEPASPSISHSYRDWMKKVAFIPDALCYEPPRIDERVFETVSRSLFEEKMLRLRYTKWENKAVLEATVSPIALVQQVVHIFLLCIPEGETSPLSIALHHILKAAPSHFEAKVPKNFDLRRYLMREKTFNYDYGREIELTFEFTSHILKRILDETPLKGFEQRLRANQKGPGWVYSVKLRDSQLVDGWIATWKKVGGITNVKQRVLSKEESIVMRAS